MNVTPELLESLDPTDWHEDRVNEQLRVALHKASHPVLIRQLYPFRAKMIVKSIFCRRAAGAILEYARTSWEPSPFPIQVLDLDGQPHRKRAEQVRAIGAMGRDSVRKGKLQGPRP